MASFLESSGADRVGGSGGEAVYRCRFAQDWWIIAGPNGGILAAMLARALEAEEAHQARARPLRVITLYYLARPQEGVGEIVVRLLRRGRNMSFYSARIEQEGRVIVEALASLGAERDSPVTFTNSTIPAAPVPSAVAEMPKVLPIHDHYEMRPVWGGFFTGGERAETGGWLRLREGRQATDAPLVSAASDGWPPAVFSKFKPDDQMHLQSGVPTIELTVQFLAGLPLVGVDADDYLLVQFAASEASEGFFVETGEIWHQSGRLLARSRQLALI